MRLAASQQAEVEVAHVQQLERCWNRGVYGFSDARGPFDIRPGDHGVGKGFRLPSSSLYCLRAIPSKASALRPSPTLRRSRLLDEVSVRFTYVSASGTVMAEVR